MRITHVTRQFHPAIGGIEDFVMQLGLRQLAHGHDVRVVTLNRVFDAPERRLLPPSENVAGIEVKRVPFIGSKRYPVAPGVIRHLSGADIVHVHAVDFLFDYLSLTRPLHRRPLILSTHGGFFHTDAQARLKRLYFETVTRMLIRGYDAVVPSSLADEATFRRIRRNAIKCIENGVDLDKFAGRADRDAKTIIYFGRLAPNKRIDRLVDWFAALHRLDPDWRLIVAGKPMGVSPADVRRRSEAAGVEAAVEIHDTPSNDLLGALIARSSVYACASDYEGFGLAAVEAIASGMFPVLSDIPAFRRTVERVGLGLLSQFEPSSASAAQFLDEQAKWRRSAQVPGQLARLFGWEGVAAAFQTEYDLVLRRNRRDKIH